METEKLLIDIIARFEETLGKNLVGLYLHGSLAMGCFTPKSDIDLIAIVKEPMEFETKRALIDEVLKIGPLPEKGLEMSIILEKNIKPFVHPMPFELHYSPEHKARYESDPDYICGCTTDRDLAAHLTVVKKRGVRLFGKQIEEVFGSIPRAYFIDALMYDIEDARERIVKDPVNVILNLCRTLYFLRKGFVASKLEGGYWGASHLDMELRDIVSEAVKAYIRSQNSIGVAADKLTDFAGRLLEEIYAIVHKDDL